MLGCSTKASKNMTVDGPYRDGRESVNEIPRGDVVMLEMEFETRSRSGYAVT